MMNDNCLKIVLLVMSVTTVCTKSQAQLSSTNAVESQKIEELRVDTIAKKIFFCTTRIEAKSADEKVSSVGTGFLFNYTSEPRFPLKSQQMSFIVTCKHVLYGYKSTSFSFIQEKDGKPELGKKCEIIVPDIEHLAFYDPDPTIDVALVPLISLTKYRSTPREARLFVNQLSTDLVPTQQQSEELSPIQAVVFIGYPNGMRDEKNFLPIARRGYTASPYVVDFNGLPLFLIDAGVFPGSSGSPLMVLDEGSYANSTGLHAGTRAHFLGMVSLAYFQPVEGEIQFKPVPTQFIPVFQEQRFLNIGGVIKAKAILNTMAQYVKLHPLSSNQTRSPYEK
jgi:hypothetical protein